MITLNAPAKLNALTFQMGEQLSEVLSRVDYTKTNCLVITGAGKAFSAGGDLNFLLDRSKDSGMRNSVIMRRFYSKFLQLRDVPVPVIAALNGPAIGAGFAFSLAADIRVAARSAKLGLTFVGLGLHPGMGSTFNLPKLIGHQRASKMLLTGEVISGAEAADIGLVLEAVEDNEVLHRALSIAETIAAQAPVAVRSCVRSLRLNMDEGLERALWREADAQSYSYSTHDLVEGVKAVAGKRKPDFKHSDDYTA